MATQGSEHSTLLADVAGIVSRSHDLAETLGNVVERVAKRLEADVCSLYLSDPARKTLVLRATKGLAPESVGHVRLLTGEGLVGLVAREGRPLAVEHAEQHPNFRFFPETGEDRFASLMATPLVVRGVAIGVLVVQTVAPRHFSQQDVELLHACGQMIAPVVLNAALLDLVAGPDEERSRFVQQMAEGGMSIAGPAPDREERNVELRGTEASSGIAIGPVYLLEDPLDLEHVDYQPSEDSEQEARDLRRAVAEARRELGDVADEMGDQFGPEFSGVFNTHVQILEDHGFLNRLDRAVTETGNALQAIRRVVEDYRALFARIEDDYFRDRGLDVEDVGRRVMAKLLGVRHQNVPLLPGSVVVTSMILPQHFTLLEMDKVGAIVTEHGGATSHGAIFARTLELPCVTGAPDLLKLARPGEMAIVDGTSGRVYLSPDEGLLAEYRRAQQRFEIAVEHLDALKSRPAETRDGRRVLLTANVGLLADLRLVERHGAEGVGLFRSELLAFAHRGIPPEEEQQTLYERVAQALAPRPVTIRTFDLGGDKAMPTIGVPGEENPQLGCRSVRLSLRHPEVMKAQLRAILRASAAGNVRLLLPMISSIDELREVRRLVHEAIDGLSRAGEPHDPRLPMGIMVEVPSAALIADALARECDFFSIGTNDLTQYALAVDRGNEAIAHLYQPLHPAVLRLIDRSARAAREGGIPVSVCGEMASNALAVPLLVGLGIGELSVAPRSVPIVKEIVRALDSAQVAEDARYALAAGTVGDVEAIACARLEKAGLRDHPNLGGWITEAIRRAGVRAR
ncbi:phosphoenolpyruvate--protein phosphotransferase [Myxococcota bacterium]|nr:phosphoenolpyruvate--protein phosphotransferase [Myxococcota bacterium]MCZ7617868.1 phosphoenolpyruvate--protein phosphotransferase [Myxococcota bacterium]